MHITAKGETGFWVWNGQSANPVHCASDQFSIFMVNCLNINFCFTYEPRNFYVNNALSWAKETKKQKRKISPLNLILAGYVSQHTM